MKAQVILVIEDNPNTRKIVRLTLANEGFAVIEAGDGAAALRLASKTPPDLILQDLLLPDMDGFELVSRLRALPELAGVPIIAFSGFLSRLDHGRAAAAGFTDFMPKPVEPSRLVQVIRAHLALDVVTPEKVGRGQRVLVVDDDAVQLKLARIRLTGLGLAVATATDGAEALDVLQRGGTDAVVSDILMPRLDGFGLCVAIRKDPRFSQIPVILVSSNYVEGADRQLARTMGANAFVVRTPDLADVVRALATALNAPSDAPLPSVHSASTEYNERVLRQLERQAALNAAFAHQSAMHASMLSVVAGISESLTKHHSVEGAGPDILASLLEASGVSMGALFERNARAIEPGSPALDDFVLRAHTGFSGAGGEDIGAFFGHPEIFERAVATKSPLVVGSNGEFPAGRDLLALGDPNSTLLVPFVADEECLGILLLASQTRDFTEGDWIPFARTMAVQIGQAFSLSRAFSKLATSENRYRLLVEGANDCIFMLDTKGHCRDLNPAMERFLGRSRSEVIGAHISAFVAPDDRERSIRDFGLLIEQGSIRVDARRFTRPDGSVVMGDLSATAVDVEGGLLLGIMRDVTEKNQADAEIRILESLTLAASEAPDLVSTFQMVLQKICQTNGTNGWMAGAAWVPRPESGGLECACFWTRDPAEHTRVKVLGEPVFASGEGLLGRAWSTKKPVWVRDLAAEAGCSRSTSAAALGVHAALAVPVIANDNVITVIEFFMNHVRAEDERFVNLVSASCAQLASIIARKGAEDALHASEARFARLAESGIIGIMISDITGNILEANDEYLRMVGYSRMELVGGNVRWSDLTPPEFKDLTDSSVAQLKEHGVARVFEKETLRKGGSRLPVLVGAAMLEYPKFIAFMADLTERKKFETALRNTENQLRHAQKMDAVGRLAGGIAHDFNNLLSVILGYSQIMLNDLKSGDPMRNDVEQVCKAGKRAADLTRQLLMFSRQQVVEPKVLDLNDVIAGMHKMLTRILGEDVELISLRDPSLGRIKVDPGGIEQVVMNLVVNARDATPTGGKLTLETANVVLDEAYALSHLPAKAGPYVMLAVSDNGIGMDSETQARIFEPFFTTKEVGKGTGLGLSTVFGIVQQSSGNIWVHSEPGMGTTFKVYLPSVADKVDVMAPQVAPSTGRGSETILLVEDDEQVRTIALSILRRQGYHVIPAQNAGEGLLLSERYPGTIDLLLTDVVMPQMSGPELAKRLALTRPQMKILCMSGYTDNRIVRDSFPENNLSFLGKPITFASLTRKVRQVLDARPLTTRILLQEPVV